MLARPGRLASRTRRDRIPLRPVDLPIILTATVPLLAPSTVVIVFGIGGTPPILPASTATGFTVKSGGVTQTISSSARTAEATITLTLSTPIVNGATVTLDYAPGNVKDTANSALASFSTLSVINLA